jgi:ELWxxDGT repeat protein
MDRLSLARSSRAARCAVAVTILAGCLSGTASADQPHLLLDLNTQPLVTKDSVAGDFYDQGSWSWFLAQDAVLGMEPWRTDGTPEGTYLLADTAPGSGFSGGVAFRIGNRSYFGATSGLWITDGTRAGTRAVSARGDHPALQSGEPVGGLGNDLVLRTHLGGVSQLWRTDGTEVGTQQITSMSGFGVAGPMIVDQELYFFFKPQDDQIEIWRGDGTAAGNTRIGTVEEPGANGLEASSLAVVGNQMLFLTSSFNGPLKLWRIVRATGAVEGVATLAGSVTLGGAGTTRFTTIGDVAVFTPGTLPATLWRSDGTAGGTFQFANVVPNQELPWAVSGPLAGGRRVFVASDGNNGFDLWTTDGTQRGTFLIDDLQGGGGLGSLWTVGSTAVYAKGGGNVATSLWRSDGTVAGTKAMNTPAFLLPSAVTGEGTDVYLNLADSGSTTANRTVYRYNLATDTGTTLTTFDRTLDSRNVFSFAQGKLYFTARTDAEGDELWISDGTSAGTRMLKNLLPETATAPSRPHGFIEFDNRVYFSAISGSVQTSALWRTGGTEDTTEIFANISGSQGGSDPRDMFVVGDKLVLFAHDASAVYHLYSTDGRVLGQVGKIADLYAPGIFGVPRTCESRHPVVNGFGYFAAQEATGGVELWRTDGTAAGTTRVADINPGPRDSAPCYVTAHDGRIFFAADGGAAQGGTELWVSDGTSGGTHRVRSTAAATGSAPKELLSFGGSLYFISTGVTPAQLWKSDGTSGGTAALTDAALLGAGTSVDSLRVTNNTLLFTTSAAGQPTRLWRTDGTRQGTARLDNIPFVGSSVFTTVQRAYFGSQGPDSADDIELWASDGTSAGSAIVLNLGQGGSANLSAFGEFGRSATFQFLDPIAGPQLWKTNGISSGSRLLATLNGPLAESDSIDRLTVLERLLLFAVDDRDFGAEPYIVANERPITGADQASVNAGAAATLDVVANDTDPDGQLDPASVSIVEAPANGTAVVNPSGTITYTAPTNFAGSVTFRYSVADEQGITANGTVSIGVNSTTNPPPPPPPSGGGGGGGGGAFGVLTLLALLLLQAARSTATRRIL